ncbi:hypothetical protein HY57_01400 [Dyella japonica A8]|uniref:Uncharacterized protein n=2 Tax=Dyella japonica TaxID=231455 RepID=A0A075JWU5_9GAMM|nr:hypothetical protein HY57_01400 [Dyella japonica A8]
MSLKSMSTPVIAMAITASFVSVVAADGIHDPLANSPQGGVVVEPSSHDGGTSATVSFEYFPNGSIRRIQMHCSQGTVPRIESEGGVIRQSCQQVADQSGQPVPSR